MTSPLLPESVAQMVADNRDDVFLIMKRDLYYRPNAQGYTGIKDHAGRYTLEQVAAMFTNMDSPHQDGTEFIRECDAPEYTKACYHDLKEAHQAQRLTTLAAENATLRAEQAMLKFDIDKMLTQIEGHNAAWDELRASEAAAVARADHARDAALVEAASVDWSSGRDTTDPAPDFLSDWQRGLVAGQTALRTAILALRDKPVPAVTVREAARVLLDQPYGVMSVAFDAMEKLHGEGADRIMAVALRAIAGGGDE